MVEWLANWMDGEDILVPIARHTLPAAGSLSSAIMVVEYRETSRDAAVLQELG